ncbi:putative toxin-antitoxin system toxin component, PIN family [Deinococcus marmoris]|uniref:PIN domain-containing protein n=1 Tax=Deinococcus marmoris TaxID=249408 RepID=UPI0009DF263B|nr:PIN domain-containing protein [Deinococcus marmoris]
MTPAHPGVVVLCDANVLYKSLLRDLMVRLGKRGVIQPHWSERIHEEWMRNLQLRRPQSSRAAMERTRRLMDEAIPGALVAITKVSAQILPDPDDQHVLDAALSAGASLLLTFNLADFPASALPPSVQAVHPDVFLAACLEGQQAGVLESLRELRADLKRPPFSPDDLLGAMRRAELPAFAAKLQPFRDSL